MKAQRDGDNYTVILTPQEAHILVWGGPPDVCEGLESMLRTSLVNVEDNEFTDIEYHELFGDLSAMWSQLRTAVKHYQHELAAAEARVEQWMVHDLYIGENPPSLGGNVSSEWDHNIGTAEVIRKLKIAVHSNPSGEQLHVVLRSYEP